MKKFLLRADTAVQAILLAPTLAGAVFILPLILMIPLGGWQLASALAKGLAWRSRFHLAYFGLASAYCLALWAVFSGIVEINFSPVALQKLWGHEVTAILAVVVIPLVGAIKYWKVSYEDCERHDEQIV